jgi:hypothetical protein
VGETVASALPQAAERTAMLFAFMLLAALIEMVDVGSRTHDAVPPSAPAAAAVTAPSHADSGAASAPAEAVVRERP